MTSPYVGEIRLFPWNWAPRGWHLCDGSLLPIAQNQALFALIGTYYGGNGTSNFALPNTLGRTAVHFGNGATYPLGASTGTETVSLNVGELPMHTHQMRGQNAAGTSGQPNNHVYANTATTSPHYAPDSSPLVALIPTTVQNAGGSVPHDNMQPFLVLNYCISMSGYFPPRN